MTPALKRSLLLTTLMCVGFGFLYWRRLSILEALEQTNRELATAIRTAGFDPEATARGDSVPTDGVDTAPGAAPEDPRAGFVRRTFGGLVALMSESHEGRDDVECSNHFISVLQHLLAFEESDVKWLAAAYRAPDEVEPGARGHALYAVLEIIGRTDPAAGLRMLDELGSRELWQFPGDYLLYKRLIAKDPVAGYERYKWMKSTAHPECYNSIWFEDVLEGLAAIDPAKALHLAAGDNGFADPESVIKRIGRNARTDEARTAGLEMARTQSADDIEFSGGVDPVGSYLTGISQTLSGLEPAVAFAWMDSAGLTSEERQQMIRGLEIDVEQTDPGPWIAWIQQNATDYQGREMVTSLVSDWTGHDYNQVATWINGLDHGPLRACAVKAFATTLEPYEPAAAAVWAAEMSDSPERRALIQTIFDRWRSNDPDAAAAFAEQQGIAP